MSRTVTVLALILALVLAPSVVAAAEAPNFRTTVPEPTLVPGTTGTLTVNLENDAADPGGSVRTAEDVRATVSGDGPIEVESGTRLLGSLGDGEAVPVTVRVSVPADAPGGSYRLPIEVSYVDPEDPDERVSTTVYATVRVEERPRFVVESVDASAPVGATGSVSVTVRNVGNETASAAALSLASTSPDVRFGTAASASRFVGEWAPGETRTLTYEVAVAEGAETRPYTLTATVEYENEDGLDRRSRPMRLGLTPRPEQTFALVEVTGGLRVGEEGTLRGRLRNTGEKRVGSVVLVLRPPGPTLSPVETEAALGALGPGEAADFAFDLSVSSAAGAGPRQFSFVVEYRGPDGTVRRSDQLDARVGIAPEREEFAVRPLSATFEAGSSGRLVVELTNRQNGTLTDVSAKLFADAPVSTSDDEAFVESLDPGESVEITFAVSVAGDALAGKTYPVEMDFRYETAAGETRISDTYQVPVEVVEADGDGLPVIPIAVGIVLVLLAAAGVVLYGRR